MIYRFYKKQMIEYGESYASAFYIIAAVVLALCGAGLHKFYDTAAGLVFLITDIGILALQFLNKAPKIRAFLLFGGSFIGALILFNGSIFDDVQNAVTNFEWFGAIVRLISNGVLVFAAFCGVMTLFPHVKTGLPAKPGIYYLISYTLFFIFSATLFYITPSILSFGYIVATLLWLLASNAIRLKFDKGTNSRAKD